MKNNKIIYLIAGVIAMASCKKDYLNRPSPNSPTLDVYYDKAEQVQAATGYLYYTVWSDFQNKAFHAIGEVLGGNMLSETGPNYGNGSYMYFTVLGTDPLVSSAWNSFYKVAGNATVLMNTFQQKKSGVSDPSFLNTGIAECRFMRGVAYFYIARTFGDAPIVTDPVALAGSGDYAVPRYLQKDVLRFALEDLRYAEQNLPTDPYQKGRVTRYSAAGMMSKLYLYRGDYDSAKLAANEVIQSGKYDLYPDYQKMFTSSSANNNIESLFALQWLAAGGYGGGNPIQSFAGPSPLFKPDFGTGYSSVFPSLDMLKAYEPGDKRRGWSIMEQGFKRSDWINANFPNGYLYDTTNHLSDATHFTNGTRSNAYKYFVGPLKNTAGENVNSYGFTDMCTYMLRYADVLLIYAEGAAGSAGSTTDASALAAFNKVRTRAGLPAVTGTLTRDQIFHERRVELAFEGDYWYDVQRQGATRAMAIINAQERGQYSFDGGTISSLHATFTDPKQLYLPIPQPETVQDVKLTQPAVPYYK